MVDRWQGVPGGVGAWDQEQARQAAMKPEADRLIGQFQRGLMTVAELSSELGDLDSETGA